MDNPKVLVLDIETSPIIAAVWGLKDQNIALNQIRRDWAVIAIGAKWLGDPLSKFMYYDLRNYKKFKDYNTPINDLPLLKIVWNLLDKADIVITQNGKNFDGPKLTARFIINGLGPTSPYKHLDTYRIAKNVAGFTSNKLEYLTHNVCDKYKKYSHGKFSGMSLWNNCENGNLAAWDEMKKYNKYDVLSTEELYNKFKPWTPKSMPSPAIPIERSFSCKHCGSFKLLSKGLIRTVKERKRKYVCHQCGRSTTRPVKTTEGL